MDPENKNDKYDATAAPRYSRDKFDAAMRSLKEQAEIVRRQIINSFFTEGGLPRMEGYHVQGA